MSARVTLPERTKLDRQVLAIGMALLLVDLIKHGLLLACGQYQPWGDSAWYWEAGGAVARGDVWLAADPVIYRTPGYAWFVGLCRWLAGSQALLVVVLLQHLAVVVTDVLVVGLVARLTGEWRWGLLAGFVQVLSTTRPLMANWLLTESIATLLGMIVVASLVVGVREQSLRWVLLGSVALGAGLLVRPALIALVPAFVFAQVIVVIGRRAMFSRRPPPAGGGLRARDVGRLAAPFVVLSAIALPWMLRNARVFDSFTLCKFSGRELWTASFSPWPGGDLALADGPATEQLRARIALDDLDLRHHWTVSDKLRASGLNDREVDDAMQAAAWEAIRAEPGRALFRTGVRAATFWYCWDWPVAIDRDLPHETELGLYASQTRWELPAVRERVTAFLEWTPERQRSATVAWSLLTWIGGLTLLARPPMRLPAIVLLLSLVSTTLLTAIFEIPLYRYRAPLEPVMAVIITTALGTFRDSRRSSVAGCSATSTAESSPRP